MTLPLVSLLCRATGSTVRLVSADLDTQHMQALHSFQPSSAGISKLEADAALMFDSELLTKCRSAQCIGVAACFQRHLSQLSASRITSFLVLELS